MISLDVGCGHNPRGNVNVDLFLHHNLHRVGDLKDVPNLVCADCHHLPFRDAYFDVVFCFHLLEHKGIRFIEACRELMRVTKTKLIIKVPSELRRSKFSLAHNKICTKQHFRQAFSNNNIQIRRSGFKWIYLFFPIKFFGKLITQKTFKGIPNPLHFLPCPIPTELTVKANAPFIGKNLKIHEGVKIHGAQGIHIGDNVALNNDVWINAIGGVQIGTNVIIGPKVIIHSANHKYSNPNFPIQRQGHEFKKVVIEDDVWIGAGAIILPGVKIGKGAVVAAGSIVTKEVLAYTVVAGNPAHKIKDRQ